MRRFGNAPGGNSPGSRPEFDAVDARIAMNRTQRGRSNHPPAFELVLAHRVRVDLFEVEERPTTVEHATGVGLETLDGTERVVEDGRIAERPDRERLLDDPGPGWSSIGQRPNALVAHVLESTLRLDRQIPVTLEPVLEKLLARQPGPRLDTRYRAAAGSRL